MPPFAATAATVRSIQRFVPGARSLSSTAFARQLGLYSKSSHTSTCVAVPSIGSPDARLRSEQYARSPVMTSRSLVNGGLVSGGL